MANRLGLIGRGTLLGMLWGITAGTFYGTTWQQGALVGLALWGPCVFVAVPGPHPTVYDPIRVE